MAKGAALSPSARKRALVARKQKQRAAPRPLEGAAEAPLPAIIQPQLATLAKSIPTAGEWTYEQKIDGYRVMARIDRGQVSLVTRGGHDWAAKMPTLVAELEELGLQASYLDGEIAILGPKGIPDFNALQNAFDRRKGADRIVYFVFDAPYFEGYDLREVVSRDRRELLKAFFLEKDLEHVRFNVDLDADPASILDAACRLGLEGIMAKRADAPYVSRRTDAWLKLKCSQRQEFVICGYTDRSDNTAQVGSLLLGVYDAEGKLIPAGSVGTGWSGEEARAIKQKLLPLAMEKSPIEKGSSTPGRWSKRKVGNERWVKPMLVAEVRFAEWTPDGQIRHSSFVGMRDDKPAKSIVREEANATSTAAAAPRASIKSAADTSSAQQKVSHGDRVIDESTGITKLELVRYYEAVADFMLPHLKDRPCSLVRGPAGVKGELFFQKHGEKIGIPGIRELPEALWPGHASLLVVGNAKALAGAAQMNVIEFHTWNSAAKAIEKPDRMILDLDPGEGTPWLHVQEAAMLVRTMLEQLKLEAWLKTSGGKGLHVVVPLAPRYDYDTVKGFSQAIVRHLAKTIPSRFVAKSGPSNRVGKLFVDYLRNGRAATTAAAFSARARPGMGVSIPVAWEELEALTSGAQWNVRTAMAHLVQRRTDPWAGYWKARQSLAGPMRHLGFKR